MTAPAAGRPAVLYAGAALLLALGGLWWVRAAPEPPPVDVELAAWRDQVVRSVPERDDEIDAGLVVLDGEQSQSFGVGVRPGPYLLSVACAGRGRIRVSVSTSGEESSERWPLRCVDSPEAIPVPLGLADSFQLEVVSSTGDRGVFRWSLRREPP